MAGSDGMRVPLIDAAGFANPVTWTFNETGTSGKRLRVREEGGQLLLEVLASGTAILFR